MERYHTPGEISLNHRHDRRHLKQQQQQQQQKQQQRRQKQQEQRHQHDHLASRTFTWQLLASRMQDESAIHETTGSKRPLLTLRSSHVVNDDDRSSADQKRKLSICGNHAGPYAAAAATAASHVADTTQQLCTIMECTCALVAKALAADANVSPTDRFDSAFKRQHDIHRNYYYCHYPNNEQAPALSSCELSKTSRKTFERFRRTRNDALEVTVVAAAAATGCRHGVVRPTGPREGFRGSQRPDVTVNGQRECLDDEDKLAGPDKMACGRSERVRAQGVVTSNVHSSHVLHLSVNTTSTANTTNSITNDHNNDNTNNNNNDDDMNFVNEGHEDCGDNEFNMDCRHNNSSSSSNNNSNNNMVTNTTNDKTMNDINSNNEAKAHVEEVDLIMIDRSRSSCSDHTEAWTDKEIHISDNHVNEDVEEHHHHHSLMDGDCDIGQQQQQHQLQKEHYHHECKQRKQQQQQQPPRKNNRLIKISPTLANSGACSVRQDYQERRRRKHCSRDKTRSCYWVDKNNNNNRDDNNNYNADYRNGDNEDHSGDNCCGPDRTELEQSARVGTPAAPTTPATLRCGGCDAHGHGIREGHEGARHAKCQWWRKRRPLLRLPPSPVSTPVVAAAAAAAVAARRVRRWSPARWLLRADLLIPLLLCITLNTTATLSSATTVEQEPVEDRDQQNRELLLPTIAQRHLLTRQQQRSFYSNEVVRLLNQRQNTSAALQYIEEAHDKWNRKQESCHRANLTPFGIKLTLERDQAGHIVSSKYQIFERAERIAQRTADFLARLFQKSVPKHLHPKGRDSHDDQPSSHVVYAALTSANLVDSSDGRMIVGSGIVIEERGVNIYAYQLGRGHHVQYHANYSYDSDESILKSRWYRDLVKRWGATYSRIKHPAGTWSSPYFDCGFSNHWLITYAAPIIIATTENSSQTGEPGRNGRGADRNGNDTTGSPAEEESLRRLLGVATVSINLNRHDINQCHGDDPFFSDTHHCDPATTTCDPVADKGFRRGNYRCRCREGYYLPPSLFDTEPLISGHAVEMDFLEKSMNITEPERTSVAQLRCLPCPLGCTTCEDEVPCFVEANTTLRGGLLITQLVCGFLVLIMMFIIYKLRKNRQFASSMWILLEAICFGALLIYVSIMCRYFEPSAVSCILEPWLRELGFATLYGAIVLKIYRIVAEFQTRKAHRVCVRSKDLLRYLIGLVLSVALYMAAWTAMVVDSGGGYADDILVNSTSPQGLRFLTCRPLVWDLVTECAEILFLGLSMRLAFRLRNAQSFPEAKGLSRAISVEAGFSVPLYILKHTVPEGIQPDYVFLAYFIRCHLTVTLVLMLIFLPKLCHRRGAAARNANTKGARATGANQSGTAVSNESCLDPAQRLHQAIVGNGELDIAEISLADMDPEEIRAELRRAYTQLEVLRNKSMRRDNPHISKRRGGRKATHRRFSLQPFHHRHKHNSQQNQQHSVMASASGTSDHRQHGQHHGHQNHPNLPETTEVSKTPEESTASMEGTFAADGPSVTSLSAEHRGGDRGGGSHKHHH